MKKFIYVITPLIVFFTACKDNSTVTPSITCLNGGYAQAGECVCTEGYKGEICNQQETPDVINVSKIIITDFPSTDENGAGWDAGSGPDIFPIVSKNNENIWESDTYYENASAQNTYSFEPNIQFTEPNQKYQINLYDYDQTGSDFMGGVIRTPYSSNNGFPDTLSFDAGGDVVFDVLVSYKW